MVAHDFRDALVTHLDALQRRDIDAFTATLGDEVTVVDGSGTIVTGRDAIVASHRNWFAALEAWTFVYEIVQARDFDTSAYALIDVSYRHEPDAVAAKFLLALVFAKDPDGTWKFVYDQNTPKA